MLGRLLQRPTEERATWSLGQFSTVSGYLAALSSTSVTVDDALTHAATAACIDVLASSVAALPIDVVRYQGTTRLPVSPVPPLVAGPSGLVERDVWVYQVLDSLLTDGNLFGLITKMDRGGWPQQIELVDPAKAKQRQVVDGVRQITVDGDVLRAYPYGDLLHIPGKLVRAGNPFAASPVQRAAQTIGSALAARRFGSEFFTGGAHPSSIVYADRELDHAQAKAIKKSYVDATSGREPAVMGAGLKVEQIQTNPGDSQFLELMRFAIEEACRFFRVPPSMVYAATSGQNVTYANVSQADLHYLKHSLDGYLVRIENALTALLPRPQVARFNRSALLRADAESRHKVYDVRLRNKSMTVDEVRALEDEPPFGGDFAVPGIPGGPDGPAD